MGYDLQDSFDIARLENDFSSISVKEWEEYMAFASEGDNWKRFDKKGLYVGLKNAGKTRNVSHKQMNWAVGIAEAIEKEKERIEVSSKMQEQIEKEQFNQPLKHFTLRVAWHDNAWNGTVCKDPLANRYCNGYHSLLSERLRIDKENNIDNELKYAGKDISEIDYLPPCYWSVNLNGKNPLNVEHYNPAAKELNKIPEVLESHSMFSWPFAIAFNRTKKQIDLEGSYPTNLDQVRIPIFKEKIKEAKSIAFTYAKFSNPFTEEERQYLVVGAAIVEKRGKLLPFEPKEAIEEKRKKHYPRNKNFPQINWALQFSFDKGNMVMMPYHDYLAKANLVTDSEKKQEWLDKIKVAVDEPELNHCFKYVAMDIDDDEAIYILSKMRQKLFDCRNDGVVAPEEMNRRIEKVDELTKHCWEARGYFPGFIKLAELLLQREKVFTNFFDAIKILESDSQSEKIQSLILNPTSDSAFRIFKNDLFELKETLERRGISAEQFIQLSMLNLSKHQFERILSGRVSDYDAYKHEVAIVDRTPLEDVCNNPYLLVEEYKPQDNLQDETTGEEIDLPIELFKIDIAYFPDARVMPRLDIQRNITLADKRRLRCVIISYLNSLEQNGDCFEEATELENALRKYPLFYQKGNDFTLATDIFKKQVKDRDGFFEENGWKLKIIDANNTRYYYLNEIFEAEKKIGDCVLQLLSAPKNNNGFRNLIGYINKCITEIKPKLKEAFNEDDFKADREQLYANLFNEKVFVLAGGPGSGKSHELLNILTEIKSQGENYLLLAPTGKAALRLKTDSKFKDIESSTIEKWLSEIKSGRYSRDSIGRINNLVIDEMSMVSLLKFWEVLKQFHFGKPLFKRLILVGDPNQLPAIGYGKILKDILYFLKSHTEYKANYIELTGNLRSELSKNKVIKLSEAFEEKGELEEELENVVKSSSGDKEVSEGFKISYWKDEKELKQKIESEFDLLCTSKKISGSKQERLHQVLGLSKNGSVSKESLPTLDNFQILTPYLSGLSGADGLNDFFQRTFKNEFKLELAQGLFKESDKIIRTKNYYEFESNELLISNGSIGIIRENNKEVLQFQEDGYKEIKLKTLRKSEREFFELAYAISVHKSQGSGFDHLFIIIPDRPGLLSRELIYTALTRCRKSVTLFIQINNEKQNKKSLLEFARNRSFTDSRKTSLLLDQPFRYFSLQPEKDKPIYVQSRTELMIYQTLKNKREELGTSEFDFSYEKYPVSSNGEEIKIRTDFTVISKGKVWYWEHLGMLGNRVYDRTWKNLKRPTYINNSFESDLITTDELKGLSTDKIERIIQLIIENKIETEDKTNKFSLHHYSLR